VQLEAKIEFRKMWTVDINVEDDLVTLAEHTVTDMLDACAAAGRAPAKNHVIRFDITLPAKNITVKVMFVNIVQLQTKDVAVECARCSAAPVDSTANQFFTTKRFDAYRSMSKLVAEQLRDAW
jgi:hypothetical protein